MRSDDETDLPRKAVRLPLELRVHVLDTHGAETLLMSHDWSANGVFLRTRHPLPVGTLTRLSVLLPGGHAPVTLRALVTRNVREVDPENHRPPGMGMRLVDVPAPLLVYLHAMARQRAVLKPESILVELPSLLLVGGERPERLRYAVYLDAHGYDVADADTPDEAMDLLAHDVDPVAFVVIDEGATAVALQKKLMGRAAHAPPRAVVLLGEPHGGFEGPLSHAIAFLPRHTDPAAVKASLDAQMHAPPLHVEAYSETDGD